MASATYQFEINDNANNALADISTLADDAKGSYRLSRPSSWAMKVACDQPEVNSIAGDGLPNLGRGRRLKVRRNGTIIHNGIIMNVQRDGDENQAFATLTSMDPLIWWTRRVVRDGMGNLALPSFPGPISGPDILYQCVANSIAAEGQMGLDTSTGDFDFAVPPATDLSVAMSSFPKTMADLLTLLTDTGEMDVIIEPIDSNDGFPSWVMGRLNAVSMAGRDQPSVHFDYGMGDFSISKITHIEDLSTLVNKLYLYFGPNIDPEHWPGLITADAFHPENPGYDPTATYLNPLGARGSQAYDRDIAQIALNSMIAESRSRYGIWMDVQIYEAAYENNARAMYEVLWQTEVLLRSNGRELINFTPSSDCPFKPFDDFNLGDVVRGNISREKFGIGFDNVSTRIYGFDIEPGSDGVERMGQLVTSADAE